MGVDTGTQCEFEPHNIGAGENCMAQTLAGNVNIWLKTRAKVLRLSITEARFALLVNSKVANLAKFCSFFILHTRVKLAHENTTTT
jgi:hypothetical protein